ncbi:MAG: rod shape-determining protein MreC [Leptospirales bacterium]|nr:rod shape-determining protein MreC [Leptospirales bacterium]
MEFFEKHKPIVIFLSLSLFCIISLSVQGSGITLTTKAIMGAIVTPFQKIYDYFLGGPSKFWVGSSEYGRVREELVVTRTKLQTFESTYEEILEIKKENNRLRALLDMKELLRYDSIVADVISKDPDNWYRTLIINRGKNDGIMLNMPVVAYQTSTIDNTKSLIKGVVGKVVEVRGSVSYIQPLIAPEIKIGVNVGENQLPGLLSGYSHNSNLCVVNYITRTANVKFDDIVTTSGQAGVFPSGLIIGKVIKSEILESSPYQRAIVKPFMDYNLIDVVFVIKKTPNKELFELFGEIQ